MEAMKPSWSSVLTVIALAYGLATLLIGLLAASSAMLTGNGRVILDFNRFHEGWLEVGLLVVGLPLYVWMMARVIRRERRP